MAHSQDGSRVAIGAYANDGIGNNSGHVRVYSDLVAVAQKSIGGSVFSLAGSGLVLQNNFSDDLAILGNGAFAFPQLIDSGLGYSVTVSEQPVNPTQECLVSNGSGTVADIDINTVQVNCTTLKYSIGGTLTGLQQPGLVLQNNGTDNLALSSDSDFTFSIKLDDTSSYNVTVLKNSDENLQRCSVINGTGTLAGEDISNIEVHCELLTPELFENGFESD